MWANGGRRSDGTGQYELTGLPRSAIVIVDAWTDGHDYVQQCAAPPTRMEADTTVDLQLVSRENVSSTPDGIPLAPGFRFVSGVIFENTPAGRRPVQGVHVDYEPVMDSPPHTPSPTRMAAICFAASLQITLPTSVRDSMGAPRPRRHGPARPPASILYSPDSALATTEDHATNTDPFTAKGDEGEKE
jgi:hypothetical protein